MIHYNKRFSIALMCGIMSLSICASGFDRVQSTRLSGFLGSRVDACIENIVKPQDTDILIEPFKHLTEGDRWQTEFIGKWMLGAISSYRYCQDPELLKKIKYASSQLMGTQNAEDGYIGNYKPEDRLKGWDIWGRKYTSLSLLDYYRLTGDKKALKSVSRLIDGLIAELHDRNMDISMCGYYRGMPSSSILEPVVYLFDMTNEKRYLDFALEIVDSIEKEGNTKLITKSLDNVPVAHRFDFPSNWWSYENGHKAYEMMSCYVGLLELGKRIGNEKYVECAKAAADNILENEINIAGSGAAFECWYDGKARQTTPAYHTMETCVTFTWMQLLNKLWDTTHESRYADELERTIYNALTASLKDDGRQISKYSPLEGCRQPGEHQCGLPINCCNANGPRGFAMIPDVAAKVVADTIFLNLFEPMRKIVKIGKNEVVLTVNSDIPVSGVVNINLASVKSDNVILNVRVPDWCFGNFSCSVNDTKNDSFRMKNGYLILDNLEAESNDILVSFDIDTRIQELNGMQAVTRGPVVFCRNSIFNDGFIDECCVVQSDDRGIVGSKSIERQNSFPWLTIEIPVVSGTDLENPENSSVKYIKMSDFGTSGNDWSRLNRYKVWLQKPINAMKSPYRAY